MENSLYINVLSGLVGGGVRAIVGITKYLKGKEGKEEVQFAYLLSSLVTAIVAGGVAGSLAGGDWRLAVVLGYAGTDFLESLYKIFRAKGELK